MNSIQLRASAKWLAAGAGIAAVSYAAYAALTWVRYGRVTHRRDEDDPLLDRFMPTYEIAERHRIAINAPVAATFAAACEMDFASSAVIRAIFRARELVLGATGERAAVPAGILEQTKALGWGVLAEVPGREIVMGAVTQPWLADVVFRALPPEQFAAFREPGYVKIAWTLRADPDGPSRSIHRTETRVSTTDAVARAKFRRYWAVFSPGIVIIRQIGIRLVKREAERSGTLHAQELVEG
jgi:hypothetical protein